MEEKNMIFVEQLVKTNFVKPMRRYIKKYLKNLSVTEDVSIETINLLHQANNTINNVYKLLRKNDIVDSATLMRSCMEKIMMAMMIYFDPTDTFEEFKDLEKCGRSKNTRPTAILDNFKFKLKEINSVLFEEFEDDELQLLLEETYEKLCLYTHSSIVVSMMIEVNKNNDEDLFALYFYQIAYFLEILIYSSLKYLTNDNKDHIDAFCIFMGFTLLCSRVDKNKLTEDYTNKYKDYLHWEINEHFTDKYKDEVEKLKNDWSNLQQEINENKEVVGNYIMNLSKK
ncbi:hypothetical protein EGR52_11725 [bacterium]|nr:hypothetical protein [bacterium]